MNYPEMPVFHETSNDPFAAFKKKKESSSFDNPISNTGDIESGIGEKEISMSPLEVKISVKNAFRSHTWFFFTFQVLVFVIVNMSLIITGAEKSLKGENSAFYMVFPGLAVFVL